MTSPESARAVELDTSLKGTREGRVLVRLLAARGRPDVIVCDSGREFADTTLDTRAYGASVKIHFIRRGKPIGTSRASTEGSATSASSTTSSWTSGTT